MLGQFEATSTVTVAMHSILSKAAEVARKFVPESWLDETLTDNGETYPQNNSSVILLLQTGGKSFMLTGDAGTPAHNSVFTPRRARRQA